MRPRKIATPSLSRKSTRSGGARTVTARPTARIASRLPSVSKSGSPGPSPTMRNILRSFDIRHRHSERSAVVRVDEGRGTATIVTTAALPRPSELGLRRSRSGGGRRLGQRWREQIREARVADRDVRLRAQLLQEDRDLLLLRLLRERVLNLCGRGGQRRVGRRVLLFDLDDVPTERRLHRRRDRTDRERERRSLERRHHLARTEEPELAALVLGRGIGRV